MNIQENVPLRPKTTMRIGGTARYFVELKTKEDVQEATAFATSHNIPIVVFGGGSNTIFADGEIEALVVRTTANAVQIENNCITVEAGKNLAMLINELAEQGLDLSPLTGIPGSVGGAIFGNAGQGPKGTWIDSFVESVTAYVDGKWKEFSRDECKLGYRNSIFKNQSQALAPVIWSTNLSIPTLPAAEIKAEIDRLLNKRFETQPHVKTAGSCFKATDETPAWGLIDEAGLHGLKIGDVQVSEKHANFLLNEGEASFEDAAAIVQKIRDSINQPLEVEMRFIKNDGLSLF